LPVVTVVSAETDESDLPSERNAKRLRIAVRLHDLIREFEFVRTSHSQTIDGTVVTHGILGDAGRDRFGAIPIPWPGRLDELVDAACCWQ